MIERYIVSVIWTLLFVVVLNSCGKDKTSESVIDVSNQWSSDQAGNLISANSDQQWTRKVFTSRELTLFAGLDTANLAGTTTPTIVHGTSNYPFPNPFVNYHILGFRFNNDYSGDVVLKYVVVDKRLKIIDRKVARLKASSGHVNVAIAPNLPEGQYRLYYTLSSQADVHFFKTWGNIQKTR